MSFVAYSGRYRYVGNATQPLDGYGSPPIAWSRVRELLDADLRQPPGSGGPDRHTVWLSTINVDGSSHVMPVGIVEVDGAWYFTSGERTRKSRNLARDPRCTVTVATRPFDLVVDGRAVKVLDEAALRMVAEACAGQGWPAHVDGDALTGRIQRALRWTATLVRRPSRARGHLRAGNFRPVRGKAI
ncbi:MAG TPA: pyridoxamine 5'-phosphate oxidase family protein [Mycobacterium sp.]|nr:pyridoxamine 5'-phosphate oxidase family protein [Mycobacterium sp.]HTX94139.1 pyridoxamine 5'-phosphate oxidase family protein [Mycobacterium sp.]